MEINQLKTFVTVAQEKHLTRAAERLFTSQPAVSAQLKGLEEELAVKLFDRTPKGMVLTPSGQHLLAHAEKTLTAMEGMLSEAKAIQGTVMGGLKIGVNSDFPFLCLPQLMASCREHYPGLQLSMVGSMSADIIIDIRKGKLDSGYFFGPCSSADLSIIKLADIETAVVAPVDWADKVVDAKIEDLALMPWIYTTCRCPFYHLKEEIFQHSTIAPQKAAFADTEDGIRELIKAGAGVSLIRADDADRAEKEGWGIRWNGKTPSVALNIAVQVNRAQEPIILAWLSEIRKCWGLMQEVDVAKNAV